MGDATADAIPDPVDTKSTTSTEYTRPRTTHDTTEHFEVVQNTSADATRDTRTFTNNVAIRCTRDGRTITHTDATRDVSTVTHTAATRDGRTSTHTDATSDGRTGTSIGR